VELAALCAFGLFACFETRSYNVAQAGLELTILPMPPEYWDYRCVL
jgi:hypothetical protein